MGALKSGNWHIREEILHVFLASMLLINEHFNYDFIDLVQPVAELLDDDKAKIRFVASETLNCIANRVGVEQVNEILQPILDRIAFLNLQDRFAIRALPVLKDDNIEFPRTTPMSAPVTRTKPSGQFAF